MKARFDLTDSRFYTLVTQDLERYLSEMIAPVCKAEFLAMLKTTVHFQLPEGYSPTEQTVTIFLYQLLVYKERMFRAVEFILLHAPSDNSLPACDTKPQGLLKLISDEVRHRFIALILESDPPGTKYKDIYKFFTRVAIHTKRCEALHQESQVFRHSFGGSRFEKAQREAIAGSSRLIDTSTPTTTIEASTIRPTVPFDKLSPRAKPPAAVVAVMKTFTEEESYNEDDIENVDPEDNTYCISCDSAREYSDDPATFVAAVSGGISASDKLLMACYKMVQKNSCRTPACEYSHDPGIVAAAREMQIADLLKAKRDLQTIHTNTMKVFEKDGAKSHKQANPTIQRKPNDPNGVPTISLMTYSPPGPQLDQDIGREHECYQRIALLSRHIPANILSHGCQTEVALLCTLPSQPCLTQDALLATICLMHSTSHTSSS